MKNILAALVVVFVSGGALPSVSAQDVSARKAEKKNAVFVDAGYLLLGLIYEGYGLGGGYERALLPQLSVRGNVGYMNFLLDGLGYRGFDINAALRYYPSGEAVHKFFIEGIASYTPLSLTYNSSREDSNIFALALTVGWKSVFGGGFFLEPSIGYRKAFGDMKLPVGVALSQYELTGPVFGLGLGWAF
jgi:hypothetical protein